MVSEVQQKKEEQLVAFQLDKEIYGVDIATVHEIIRMQEITRIPRAPSFIEGVINLRGKVIPVLDLRKRFNLPNGQYTDKTRIVVVEIPPHTVGLIVDAVSEVLRLPVEAIEPPSPVIANVDVEYLRGVGKLADRLIILLDLEKVLTKDEKTELAAAHAASA